MRGSEGADGASVPLPRDELRQRLVQLGSKGQRAEAYLREAARQLEFSAPLAPECSCYCVREALMALLMLGKGSGPKLDVEAPKTITAWRRYRDGAVDKEVVEGAIDRLDAARRDPNELRLEDTIRRLAHSKPTRGDADLLAEFLDYLKFANTSLHNGTDRDQADALYRGALRVIDNLFGPFADRLEALDELVAVAEPGPQEVAKLRAFVGDNRHLAYFFSCVEGPGWLQLLADDPLLSPAKDGTWPAGRYLQRLSDSEPEQVRNWLRRFRGEELVPEQASSLLYVAARLEDSISLVTALTQTNLEFTPILAQLDRYIRELPEERRDIKPLPRLVVNILRVLLGASGAGNRIWATRLLEFCVSAIETSDWCVWLTVLACRLEDLGHEESPIAIRMLPRIGDMRAARRTPRSAELAAMAVRDGIDAALEKKVDPDAIVAVLDRIGGGFGRKQRAYFLGKAHPGSQAEAEAFLLEGAAVRADPFPEEIDLLEKTCPSASVQFGEALLASLGEPPSVEEIYAAIEDRRPAGDWMRAQQWLAPVPEDERGVWAEALRQLKESLGAPRTPGSPRFRVRSGSPGPDAEALAALASLSPLEAARQLAAWSQPEARMYPTAHEERDQLLRQLIEKDPEAWLCVPLAELHEALEAPELISTYLIEVQGHLEVIDSDTAGQFSLVAERLLARALESKSAEPEPGNWGYASYRALQLCGELTRRELLDEEAVERFWGVVLDHSRVRGDDEDEGEDLMTTAINRPWTVAVDIGFSLLPGDDPRFLVLLEECLSLTGVQGRLARAIISSRLSYLRRVVPDWFGRNEALILGAAAQADLGELTYRLYLEWGRPSEELLREQRSRLLASLSGPAAEQARHHLLHGLIWELEGFDAAAVCLALLSASDESLSEAARWLAVSLERADDFSSVLALWRESLSAEASPQALAGWGWFAVNEHLADSDWLELTLATASRERANLAEAEEIARRAERIESDPRVIELVTRLLAGDPELWELEGLTAIGLRLLQGGEGGAERRRELRERLLEREVYEARYL